MADEFDRDPLEFLTATDHELLRGWGWEEPERTTIRRRSTPQVVIGTVLIGAFGSGLIVLGLTMKMVSEHAHHQLVHTTHQVEQNIKPPAGPIGPPGEPGGGIESVTVKHGHIYGLMFDGSTRDLGSIVGR